MAKEIDKIIQSKTAPKSNNVLWDDGENLKINRNGKWESASKENSSNQELYAYPVDTLDGKENKVVGLGGDGQYMYVGELIASEFGTPTEEKVVGDVIETAYIYQPIYDDKYIEYFEEFVNEKYITLYIGNDVDGYSSNKVYISEDANNLTYYSFSFVVQFGPMSLEVAISPDNVLHYRNYHHYTNRNSKVFLPLRRQQLDINLIPQEIARKEDIENYEYPTVTIDADAKTYSGQLGSKCINIDINIHSYQLGNEIYGDKKLYLRKENDEDYQYSNSNIFVILSKNNNEILDIVLSNPIFTLDIYDLEYLDYKNCNFNVGNCRVKYNNIDYSAIIDFDDFVTTLIDGKYIKYKLNRETHLLELQSELDLNSIESRLAALEAK